MNFKSIIGQSQIIEQLLNNVSKDRIGHAMLFHGPDGVGKLQLVLSFVQFLMCENKTENDSCGACKACIKNQKLIHPDVHLSFPIIGSKKDCNDYIEQFRNAVIEIPYLSLSDWYDKLSLENQQGIIPVAESNKLIQNLHLKPFESKYKVAVIWNADKLRVDAATKLLKIIEEPPKNTLFFLITNNLESLLPTMVSRTQIFDIPLIPYEAISNALIQHYDLRETKAKNLARICGGSFRTALEMLKSDGSEDYIENFLEWMRLSFKAMNDTDKLLDWVEKIAPTGRENQKVFLSAALEVIRECLLINSKCEELLKIQGKEYEKIQAFAPFIHENNSHLMIEAINASITHIGRNANPKILFLDLSLKMHQYIHIKKEELIA